MISHEISLLFFQENASNPTVAPDIHDINMVQLNDSLLFLELDQHQSHDQQFADLQTTESIQVPLQVGYIIEMMSNIQQNQKELYANQQTILKGLALVNTKLEEYFTRPQKQFQQEQHEQSSFKIITNIEEFTAFEEQLKDPIMEIKFFKEFSIVCSEKKTGHNNAYTLVDAMFDRKLMTRCSWGGGTKGEPKHCFKAFSKTIDLFLKVVHQYDETFTSQHLRNMSKRVRNSTTKKKINKSKIENQAQGKSSPGLSSVSDPNPTQ